MNYLLAFRKEPNITCVKMTGVSVVKKAFLNYKLIIEKGVKHTHTRNIITHLYKRAFSEVL